MFLKEPFGCGGVETAERYYYEIPFCGSWVREDEARIVDDDAVNGYDVYIYLPVGITSCGIAVWDMADGAFHARCYGENIKRVYGGIRLYCDSEIKEAVG